MARCPKCSFALVLLPKRNKYKCAKCSSLFRQKFIDNREFRAWNKRQRGIEFKELTKKYIKEYKRQYRLDNKDKICKKAKEYYRKNRENIRKQQKQRYYLKKALALEQSENSNEEPSPSISLNQMAEIYFFNYLKIWLNFI